MTGQPQAEPPAPAPDRPPDGPKGKEPLAAPGWVLVTGGSGGIGEELARLFARDRHPLVLVARSESRMVRLAEELKARFQVPVKLLVKDLSLPNAPEEIAAWLRNEGIELSVLVNNAGVGLYGSFWEAGLEETLRMLRLNVVSLTQLTRLLLPAMVRKGRGRVLNVASTAAFQPGPLMAVYYASKAYVLSFSEAIADELRGTGVTVTALCPGPTSTGFQEKAGIGDSLLVRAGLSMKVSTVAQAGYRGLLRGRRLVIPGWRNRFGTLLVRVAPRNLVTAVVRRVQQNRSRSSQNGV